MEFFCYTWHITPETPASAVIMRPCLPAYPDFIPHMNAGTLAFPVHHMRGGTSTGLVIWERFAPQSRQLREELLRHLMGTPHGGSMPGNRQITGLGRGPATSNKVFFVGHAPENGNTGLTSTLAQLAADHGNIDWSVNCGNMSSAIQLWAIDTGVITPAAQHGPVDIAIFNTNTGVTTTSRMLRGNDGRFMNADIPGVSGSFPAVDLFLHNPAGAKTGKLLPTGSPCDIVAGLRVSCVDVAAPMVIIAAKDLGKTAHEPVAELENDAALK